MKLNPLPIKQLPKPLPFRKLLGPSFIILGLGLGTGELILWPYLTSHYGMGIIWGAVVGVTFQFFMNMEIERYALSQGESIFVGFARKFKYLPIWFILSTFIPWMWPGSATASATVISHLIGFDKTYLISIGLLLMVGIFLSAGSVLYKTQENMQKYITIIGVPAIFILTFLVAKFSDWEALAKGIVGIGNGYFLLPLGIPLASFIGALAYAGAGGNLNLAQSSYVRDKGYGMGIYAGKIKGLLRGRTDDKENFHLTGATFEINQENLSLFNSWWKNINKEHLLVFWLTGALTMCMLGLLSYATTYSKPIDNSGINFLISEADVLSKSIIPIAGSFFLVISAVTLFGTQLGVMDATSRIISENVILSSNSLKENHLPKTYYVVLWSQIIAACTILLLGIREPLQLIIISAVLNAFTMFVHVGLTLWTNLTLLDKNLRPNKFRVFMMSTAFIFYGGFSIYTIIDKLLK